MSDHCKEAYKRFYPDLLKSLPMADTHFYVELEKKKILFGDLSEEVKAKDTEAQKATHFLKNLIDQSLWIDNTEPFTSLLEVMENFDNEQCRILAKEIKIYLSKKESLSQTATIQAHPSTTVTTESPDDVVERMKDNDPSVTLTEIFLSDKAKRLKPTEFYLKIFVRRYAPIWWNIGLELDITNGTLDLINKTYSLEDKKCMYTLQVWLANPEASWEKLFNVADKHYLQHSVSVVETTYISQQHSLILDQHLSVSANSQNQSEQCSLNTPQQSQAIAVEQLLTSPDSQHQLQPATGAPIAEQYQDVFREFFPKLVQLLPLTDAHFCAALFAKKLFFGNLSDEVGAKETNADKSTHFLNNTIGTSLNAGIVDPFVHLLEVMKEFDNSTLKSLAEDIALDLSITINEPPPHTEAIERAQKRLYAYYTNKQLTRLDWPPFYFKYFTPLTIIYVKNLPATNTANIPYKNTTTEDITSLFSAYRRCGSYKILIEGEPGIGKTILSSEIAAQWADKALLDDKALLFLLFMRQPETKNISDIKSLVEHFFHDDIPLVDKLTKWLKNTDGKYLTIVLDGYDEASTYGAFFTFVNQLIAHETLPECGLVITSRPAESLRSHGDFNCRVEMLGFTEQSRQQFINSYIEKQEQKHSTNKQDMIEHNIKLKIEAIQKVLKHNSIINTLCYIPFNLTMFLLCFTESKEEIDLSVTATTLYERFIIITMKRILSKRLNTTILSFKDLPNEYSQTFQQLAKFAYSKCIDMDNKKSMQLVFELADIENYCENFVLHGNGLGLLKPASFLDMGTQNKYSSYNFLHKSIQEYMAAYHIASLLPDHGTLSTLTKKFFDSNYFSIWVMYVGITGGKQKEFKYFLSGKLLSGKKMTISDKQTNISNKILNDKIKCLYLLRCATEAQEPILFVPIQKIFEEKIIDLSNKSLSEMDIKSLAVLLLDLPGGPWTLNLSRCNINNKCCKVLFETFTSQTVTANIETINLSFNNICSEDLYSLYHIFKLWKTKAVVLPIDALHNSIIIKEEKHFVGILEGLIQTYQDSSGMLMVLYKSKQARIIVIYSDLNHVRSFQLHNCELNEDTAKKLKSLVTEQLKHHRVGHVYFSYSIYDHHDVETLSYIVENFQEINFCGLDMHSKGVYLLDTSSKIDFQIKNDPSTLLVDYLAAVLQNSALANISSSYLSMLPEKVKEETKRNLQKICGIRVLDLANNNMPDYIAIDIEIILLYNYSKLEEVYLGGNSLQEAGMIKIAKALQKNSILKVFDISNNNINGKAVDSIAAVLSNKTKLKRLYLNGNKLQAGEECKSIFYVSTIESSTGTNKCLEELHLGDNNLQAKGIIEISPTLANITTLKVFDISNNGISSKAGNSIAHFLSRQVNLEKLNLGGNNLQDGLVAIVKELKCYSVLKVLDISNNSASTATTDKIAVLLCFQSNLEKLDLVGSNSVNPRTLQALQYFLALKIFDDSHTNVSDNETQGGDMSSHVTHMKALLLIYYADLSSLKDDITKKLKEAAKIIRWRISKKGPNIDKVLKEPLEENFLNTALLVAVQNGEHNAVSSLILHGATNIDTALVESRQLKQYKVTAALLITKAAMENDNILVMKLYGDNVQGQETKIPLAAEDNLAEFQASLCSNDIRTPIPMEISRRNDTTAVREKLLLKTGIDKPHGAVLWSDLHLMELEIAWLRKIDWVKTLWLARNDFLSLPSEMGSYLKQCTKLDLQGNRIHEIPQCLLELPSINELNLSHNDLVDIPDVPEWSASLTVLDLSYNRLSNLPNSAVAPALKDLNISNNQFCTVPHCVCLFIGLTTLNIANNSKILSLPPGLGRLKDLRNLNLDGLNNLNFPPKSFRVTTADCIQYLNNKLRSPQSYYHMKIMLVGKHAVGKSTIVAQLHKKKIGNNSRVGVDISKWKYSPAYNKKTFHFSIWDFAGQEEYYATHQCFMSTRSLYLLVWNVTEGDAGVADLKPWLNNISVQAPDSCVIVVGTFLDKVSEEDRRSGKIDELLSKVMELTRQYCHLAVTYITVVGLKGHMENVAKLKNYIYSTAAEYKINGENIMGQMIPSSYHALDKKLSTIHRLVKEGKHEPIMHAAEFQCMVRDLNLVDIQNDDELCKVTQFLHQVGALLHYDDSKNKLDDLYFIDPCWLCDLMSSIVTVKQQNPHMMEGILETKNLQILFQCKNFPNKYFHLFLTLINKFEIALPLDDKRILIPSMLPEKCPDTMVDQKFDEKNCYKRFILFNQCQYLHQGFWNRLLLHIMNNVEKVRNILSKQSFVEDDLHSFTNIFDQSFKDSLDHMTENPIKSGENLVYWRTGLFYSMNKLMFRIESLTKLKKYQDKDGVMIMASQGAEGRKILGQLIDIVKQVTTIWYPELNGEQRVPCIECIKKDEPNFYEFNIDQLVLCHELTHKCGAGHEVKLEEIVSDLLFQDLDPAFLLDPKEVIYKQEKESLLGTGKFGKVYRGKYKDQVVAIRLYIDSIESFTMLHSETKVLQQLHHPSLVHMVGVTVHPTISLVMEEAPGGSLEVPLLIEQQPFSRIILHRIAIQVASALYFLHSINIIHRNLKAANVLLWSLSPDHLINCKVTGFNVAAYVYPGGIKNHPRVGTPGFIPPEVKIYDTRADIFSFSMFLYQLLARQYPYHNIEPIMITTVMEKGQRPQLEDVPLAETGLYYMSRVMKLCWAGNPKERPTSQQIIKWMSASALQLIISVIPVSSICNGYIVSPVTSNEVGTVDHASSELWICCNGVQEVELSIFITNTIVKTGKYSMREATVSCMKECGENVWVSSETSLETCVTVMNIYSKKTKDLVYDFKIKATTVSCITNSRQLVYVGTMEGGCYAFAIDVHAIKTNTIPYACYKNVSKHCINGLALSQTCLWVSTYNHICFLNPETLDLEGVEKRTKNTHAFVGKMMLSDNGDQMWSAHLRGVIISAWNARLRTHICDVDVGALAKEKCHVKDPRDRIMTAMCTALDTVWIGLASGFIMVFGMNPPGELLTYFRPYNSYICFLSASKYSGPCQKEECMMLCGGKMYRPDESFKELTDYERKDEKGEPVDTAGVAVLWEVLPAKYTRQVQYLSDGKSWLNYSTLEKTMTATGFTESMKYCHSAISNSSTTTTQDECCTD